MGILCDCPVDASLPNIPLSDCPESLGQIQKVIFQRIYSSGTTKNKFTIASANPNVLASWTPLLAAADGTKVVQSPYINAPVVEPGAAKTYGGGNETLGGIPIIVGRDPSPFTGMFLQVAQATIEILKSYQCENVGIYLVDEYGRLAGLVDDQTTPTEVYPIPIASLFIGDKKLGGFEGPDSNMIQWSFYPNWSDKLQIITPTDFNALTDLATPNS